jgi:hypothetical protein
MMTFALLTIGSRTYRTSPRPMLANPISAAPLQSAHEPAAVQQPHAYMAPYHYGQYQYPMYPPYGQSYNVPPKYNAGYVAASRVATLWSLFRIVSGELRMAIWTANEMFSGTPRG